MALTYTEELVSEYYKHILDKEDNPKYLVSERVPYQYPEPGKAVKGWHDIDVLAVSEDEVVIIETKATISFGKREENVENIRKGLAQAEEVVKRRYKDKTITKVFITDWPPKTIIERLDAYGIEAKPLIEIFKAYLQLLAPRVVERERYGKEENNLTRLLIFLIDHLGQERLKEAGLL